MIIKNKILKNMYLINLLIIIGIILFFIIGNVINLMILSSDILGKILTITSLLSFMSFFIINVIVIKKYIIDKNSIINKIYLIITLIICVPIIIIFLINYINDIIYSHKMILFISTFYFSVIIGITLCPIFLILNIYIVIKYKNIISLIFCIFLIGVIILSILFSRVSF